MRKSILVLFWFLVVIRRVRGIGQLLFYSTSGTAPQILSGLMPRQSCQEGAGDGAGSGAAEGMPQAAGDFILAGAAEPKREGIQFVEIACKIHQAIGGPAMPDPEKMPGFVKTDFGGSEIHASRILVSEPIEGDHGGFAAKLRFAKHEFENRCAEVELTDSQPEPCAAGQRLQRQEDFPCRILGAVVEDTRIRGLEGAAGYWRSGQ